MKGTQKQIIESYQRVQVFLARNPLQPPDTYGDAKQQLDDVVTRLTTLTNAQMATTRLGMAETEQQQTLRRALREQHLAPIARVANAALRHSPGIEKATRLPETQIPTTQLLTVGAAFRQAATPYEETFVRHGLSTDFLARLDAAVEALRQSQVRQADMKHNRIAAKNGIVTELLRGRQAVQMLDALVKARFGDNRDVLATWRTTKKVLGVGGAGSASTEPAAPAPTAPATPEPKAA